MDDHRNTNSKGPLGPDAECGNTSGTNDSANGGGGGQGSGGSSEESGDAQEEESSSLILETTILESKLDSFREEWCRELEASAFGTKPSGSSLNKDGTVKTNPGTSKPLFHSDGEDEIQDQAFQLFWSGVKSEQSGKLYEAISYYRRAVQLVPDIELRIAETLARTQTGGSESDRLDDSSAEEDNETDETVEVEEETEDRSVMTKCYYLSSNFGSTQICYPGHEQKATHISALPREVFLYILKWVVSSDLDLHSLERIGEVCRGFYACVRDPEIWRLACVRVWGLHCSSYNKYGGWREMYIHLPRLHFHGAYISKTTYMRYGEPSFQDVNYRPCYLVEYFRYLRFFSEGTVLMLTTPDDPYQSLAKLRYRKPRSSSVLVGHYRLLESTVIIVLQHAKGEASSPYGGMGYYRQRRNRPVISQDAGGQNFHIKLEVKSVKGRPFFQLVWQHYSVHTIYRIGQETVSEFDLTPANFPPFWFSVVRSFTRESEFPLL